jgi:hypothetical protein
MRRSATTATEFGMSWNALLLIGSIRLLGEGDLILSFGTSAAATDLVNLGFQELSLTPSA